MKQYKLLKEHVRYFNNIKCHNIQELLNALIKEKNNILSNPYSKTIIHILLFLARNYLYMTWRINSVWNYTALWITGEYLCWEHEINQKKQIQ